MKRRYTLLFSLLAASMAGHLTAAEGYYRSPVIFQDQVVFTAEGDLWRAGLNQPQAQRITSHPAEETQAVISPDGSQLAFVADYDGNPEVYVMPLNGGTAQRISFENSRVRLQQWLADGRLLYSTDSAVGPANYWVLKTVDPKTLQSTTLPLADAIAGAVDDKNEYVYFVRFGLQVTGDNTKVYRGGAMGELWRWKLGSQQEAQKLSNEDSGSISQPMFWQDRIYFVSDKDGNSNIWSVKTDGSDSKVHTRHQEWRIGRASLHQGRIAYQSGADLQLLDLQTSESQLLPISLSSDFVQKRERWLEKPLNYLTSTSFNGKTEKVALTARSQIALATKAPQRLVQIATPEGSRSRKAVLSHDGKWVYAINDSSGENEIWRFAADGSNDAKQLTRDGSVFRWGLHLSPDGKWLAHDDKNGDLWLLELESGRNTRIYQQGWGHAAYADVVWSADSRLVAFTLNHQQRPRSQVVLYSLPENRSEVLTSDKYQSFAPAFSRDGLWLYFVSDRNFVATPGNPWGDRNLGPMFNRRAEIYAVSLKQQACFPFSAQQEVQHCNDKTAADDRTGRKGSLVDWEGLTGRLWQVPVAAGNYYNLSASEQRLYLLDAVGRPALKQIKFTRTSPKMETFAADVAEYQLSADGKTLFFRKLAAEGAGDMLIVNAGEKAPADLSDARINARSWQLAVSPVQEWQQMFRDAWLMHRDFLFDKGMRGLDWQAAKAKYQPLLERVTDRYELDDIFAQMMGELNALHSQVRGGEYRQADNVPKAASLGAELEATSRGVRVSRIYQGDPELPAQASPLAKPGVNVRNGDIIQAVNGLPVRSLAELTSQLRNQAGRQVLLSLLRNNDTVQAVVEPATSSRDHQLRYQDWVWHNQQQVSKNSEGQIGYLHLYAMGPNDIASFAREFYANYQKDGLIIDVRRNRGGNIDSWIIEKLLRRAWVFWQPTHGAPYTNMQQAFRGHLVVLTDQLTYSDGETFSAGVKALGLGPLIGKRTAGAGVWLSGRNQLADKGVARVAENAQFAMDGRWVIEGYGVTPDIEVENLPYATFSGQDAQLQRALGYLKQKLQQQPAPAMQAEPLTAPFASDIK
ncbi:S41 family peptidase [Chromatiaceae bacterium AAb-1]|nr:S41 family peptidase [Chromatiaceae bacterium AAb-1]